MSTLQGPAQSFPGATSDLYTTPYPISPGTKARDNVGNEYVFCEFSSNVYPEGPVLIGADFVATALTTTGRGPVGIVVDLGKNVGPSNVSAPVSPYTSDQAGWVQIYGRAFAMITIGGGTVVSPSDAANGPTTLSTSVGTKFLAPTSATSPPGALFWASDQTMTSVGNYVIHGMSVASDASPLRRARARTTRPSA